MKSTVLHDDRFLTILWDDLSRIIGIDWKESTAAMTDDEMKEIAGIDKSCRLIKGQVFLWKPGQSWEDLWDLDGVIKQ